MMAPDSSIEEQRIFCLLIDASEAAAAIVAPMMASVVKLRATAPKVSMHLRFMAKLHIQFLAKDSLEYGPASKSNPILSRA
jgi:hypothetical protein